MSMTHFEPGAALRQMEAEGCTFTYPCFPTITQSILRHPDYERTDLGKVRALLDTAPPATLREIGTRIPQAVVLTSYGLTEGGGVVAFSHLDDPERERTETGGRPFEGMEVRIADPETDEERPVGEVGQILVRGPGPLRRLPRRPGAHRRGDARRLAAHGRPRHRRRGGPDRLPRALEGHAQGRRRERRRARDRGLPAEPSRR